MHQSLADTMADGSLINDISMSFMGQMTLALGKLSNLEGFVKHVMVSHQILILDHYDFVIHVMAHEEANIVAGCSRNRL